MPDYAVSGDIEKAPPEKVPPGEDRSPSGGLPRPAGPFTAEEKEYLDGYLRALMPPAPAGGGAPGAGAAALAPYGAGEAEGFLAQQGWESLGKRLGKEEKIKQARNPLDIWEDVKTHARENRLPEGEDLFRFKFHGLFNVSPAQPGLMCRLRVPGGRLTAAQAESLADLAETCAGGYATITTRANLQLREIPAQKAADLLMGLEEAGITSRGAGADNVRNVTGSPTAGIDAREILDVYPLCRELHHHILRHRGLYGLPRKFNIAFDGGGAVAALDETNDIGFKAVTWVGPAGGGGVGTDRAALPEPGSPLFRVVLGGVTGHRFLARDTGWLLRPEEALPFCDAVLHLFIRHGNRSQRQKARLVYLLEDWGLDRFLEELRAFLPFAPLSALDAEVLPAPPPLPLGHLGPHPQKQAGYLHAGAYVPGGRMEAAQLRGMARFAREFGDGLLRLTVWQNFIVGGIAERRWPEAERALKDLGFDPSPDPLRAGLVACTGSEGCKFGQAPTKSTALLLETSLRGRLPLDRVVNIHITGCPHSCAQHYVGDIGLLAAAFEGPEGLRPSFHLVAGGGHGEGARIAFPLARFVPKESVPAAVETLLRAYLDGRLAGESFSAFANRLGAAALSPLVLPFSLAEALP